MDLLERVNSFGLVNKEFRNFCAKLDLKKLVKNDVNSIYIKLGNFLFQPEHTIAMGLHFRKDLPNILMSVIDFECTASDYEYQDHLKTCIALAKLIDLHPDVECFAIKYFENYPSPFEEIDRYPEEKKLKLEEAKTEILDIDIVTSCHVFLKHSAAFFKPIWNWSVFIRKYFNHQSTMVQWVCVQCIQIVTGMNETKARALARRKLSEEDVQKCVITYEINKQKAAEKLLFLKLDKMDEDDNEIVVSDKAICLGGIYLPLYQTLQNDEKLQIVEVNSTKSNLRKIALGIAANEAVCLQGPVGSGKTFLIEYLASKTGRILGENFIKVQLGDQTDSKMLLGTYRCTDIPGEFVWQPGVLTQAVLEGSWLLLEDIDLANMDIATVLSALLENGTLTVPGYRDALRVAPGFQLFLTQRLVPTVTGYYKKQTNAMSLLDRNVLQINIDPLLSYELREIISEVFPILKTIASRMVDAFLLFTRHASKSTRLISTRDLFKWCRRAAVDFEVTSQTSALSVLQDGIDIFCCSYSNLNDRFRFACDISSQLGIICEKANFFCNQYKPHLSLTSDSLQSSRVSLRKESSLVPVRINFCFTRPSSCLLERIMCCINLKEPVLLVGETGTGKTSAVQFVAHTLGFKLIVINMNQQSDSADLLGGYKPVDMKFIITPIKTEFLETFKSYFSVGPNEKFLSNIEHCFNKQKWGLLVKLMKVSSESALKRLNTTEIKQVASGSKRQITFKEEPKKERSEMFQKWTNISTKLQKLQIQLKNQASLAFSFIEGSLVKAVENGHWVLLDEINLANAETLECLSGLLEGSRGSLNLLERGDKKPIKRHPQFTLFACMNPSTDVGKRDLPSGLRNRFTEFFVDELLDKQDLLLLVNSYLNALSLPSEKLENIVKFYLNIRKEAELSLSDGLGHKPHFSLRTLCRALTIASKNPCGVFNRSLFEAFCLSFLTQLDTKSYQIVESLIMRFILGSSKDSKSVLKQPIPKPKSDNFSSDRIEFEGYWVPVGNSEPNTPDSYILTESVRRNLKDLVRVVSIGKSPVLLQGDTSVGKTSLIMYLAKSSGNKCMRINNHEHTDLQEYIGSYVADVNGKLVFREGLLVEAMRKGHWIILDELNLAPTDVLEALNRVLDDNRELFIPETQETIKAHPNFMLFATQNPPGVYGGRKMLSRAFRNRFVELHFNEIPPNELEFILHKRCAIPLSYSKKMVAVMMDLQTRRRGSAAFAGKHGFITLRDLFRWGERYHLAHIVKNLYDWDQHLADEGYLLLAGRVRKADERNEIAEALKKQMRRAVMPFNLFTLNEKTSPVTKSILEKLNETKDRHKNIVWTYNMRQLAVLVSKALEFKEPVLLVGETGGGKTTVCQLLAENYSQELYTVNCHMHTESSDFIGGLRPVRDHSNTDHNNLFEWLDGPLIKAMLKGGLFLADEISLADDSVLERLNSLLEPERTLLLAEKGCDINNPVNSELILAHDKFYFVGTMNPGGDYGKKELSPALRNRFTEIWCESCTNREDLIEIIEHNVEGGVSMGNQEDGLSGVGRCIMDFIEWFKQTEIGKRFTVSIRDILTWVNFINCCVQKIDIADAYVQGASLTFLDSFGSGATSTENLNGLKQFQKQCMSYLNNQMKALCLEHTSYLPDNLEVEVTQTKFGIKPFYISMGNNESLISNFTFEAPTCAFNTLRILRGLQLNKAILLEGSPGVGKTSLVTALAKATNHKILRINLSDQTDISDLFGADLPVEGGLGGQFAWRDGPFLQALRKGHWILLDELNLASQSVLEGLNACLDHRGEIFIPELAKTFHVQTGTRLFACQNPLKQGGSRRGLPQSFLNRFTQVYVNPLNDKDLLCILKAQFQQLPASMLDLMIEFNTKIVAELEGHTFGHKGAPWEFNLRDVTRWCEAVLANGTKGIYKPESFVGLIYSDRMRTLNDKKMMCFVFEEVFNCKISGDAPIVYVTEAEVHFGDVTLKRESQGVNLNVLKQERPSLVLRGQVSLLRSLAYCARLNWLAILVGNSGTGKSGVVKTLATLVGKTLYTLPVTSAMDTTDILGGFEQVDYTRHLEEIARHAEALLLETVQECMIKGDLNEGTRILQMWEAFSVLMRADTESQTMAEETQHFLKKLRNLEEILKGLIKHATTPLDRQQSLKDLQRKTIKLNRTARKEGNLNAGGKFEWVDSILIKCLQEGSWLLVDNVNLCSPAVLDRLNALLEPNGVLTIGERGIKENGEIVEIKPHKDFRLFFAMDPKNGEISRAMRNRGIEICILSENDSESTDFNDLKSLISQSGLKNNSHIEALIKIHYFISDMILGEKPNINHMLQASFLISQLILRGKNVFIAFYYAIIDVYYKSRTISEFQANDPLELIHNEMKTLLCGDATSQLQAYNSAITLNTTNLSSHSQIERIKQQTSLLPQLTNDANLLKYSLINFFSISTPKDLHIRTAYLQDMIKKRHKGISAKFYEILKDNLKGNCDLPQDLHWLPDCNARNLSNLNNSNRLYVLMYFITNLQLVDVETKKTARTLSLRNFFEAVEGRRAEGKLDDVLEKNLLKLLNAFDVNLAKTLYLNSEITDEEVINFISVLQWRFIIRRLLNVNIQHLPVFQYRDIIQNLHVHYRWFFKFTIKYLGETLGIDLRNLTDLINLNGSQDFSLLRKLGKTYQKHTSRPPPLISEKQINVIQRFQEISNNLDLYSNQTDFKKSLRIIMATPKLRIDLIDIKSELSFEFTEASSTFMSLAGDYKENMNVDSFKSYSTMTLPIIDYFSRLIITKLKSEMNIDDYKATLKETLTVPITLVGALELYSRYKDIRLKHELNSEIFYYILNSAAISPFKINNYGADSDESTDECLSLLGPIFTHLLCNLLISDVNKKDLVESTRLGTYRDVSNQYGLLNKMLWRNLVQMSSSSFDFVNCEVEFITNSYKELLNQLSKTLNIDDISNNHDIDNLVQLCLTKIKDLYAHYATEDVNDDVRTLTILLAESHSNFEKVIEPNDFSQKIHAISNLYCAINYLKILLNSKLPLIDPLAKIKLKKMYCLEEIENFWHIKKAYELQNEIFSCSSTTLHSHVALIDTKIKELEVKEQEYGKYVAVRPENITYNNLSMEILYHLKIVSSPKQILKLYNTVNVCFNEISKATKNGTKINLAEYQNCERELIQFCGSYSNLITVIKKYYHLYPDVITPLLDNVTEFLYGLKLKLNLHRKLLSQFNNMKHKIDLNKDIVNIIRFPTLSDKQPSYLDAISSYTDPRLKNFIKHSVHDEEDQMLQKQINFQLLMCAILELHNISVFDVTTSRFFDKKLFATFDDLMRIFINAWEQQEQEQQLKKKEEESLYKTKPKSEEKELEEEFLNLFPSHHDKDFYDILEKSLDDEMDSSEPTLTEYVGIITIKDVRCIANIHSELLQLCTKTEWLNPERKSIQHDFVSTLLQKSKIFKFLLNKYGNDFNYDVDKELVGCLNIIIAVAQRFGDTKIMDDQNADSPKNHIKKRYDFYKDPRVDEVKGSYHILEELRYRIEELLYEWQSHPTLQTIQTVINRIYNFDIASPLSRFLTGFEILLSKCHEWEQNAHSGVSLNPYTQNLIHQIIAWRKIEMNMWKDSLSNTFDRMNEPISKWWFYIYEIMLQFIEKDGFTIDELIDTLHKFITQSNLAEFVSRLNLLFNFHCHAVHFESTKRRDMFSSVLWNMHEYFKQFVPNVEQKISELRQPIEKKLKEYVKIVKWKDISYWAIKDTLEKTHKTLHKHMKEFENVLKQPASICLTNTVSDTKPIENVGIWDRPQRHSPKTYHYTMDPATYMAKRSLSKKLQMNVPLNVQESSVLVKAEKYFNKSRSLCKKAIMATKYPSLIQNLDGFVVEVIEANNRLQKLEVDTTLPKNKQKSQAKGILQQKRKALADLFKALSVVGLSYRTGIIQSKIQDANKKYLLKPINLEAAFQHLNYSRYDEKLLTIWEGCEMYYTRALMRLDTLELNLRTPAKDLGMQNAERCKGFSQHLNSIILDQKTKLIETSRTFYYLRFYSSCLGSVCDDSQSLSLPVYLSIKELLKNTLITMEQYKLILYTCPDGNALGNDSQIPVLKLINTNFPLYKQDEASRRSMEYISSAINLSQKLLTTLEKFEQNLPSTEYLLMKPNFIIIADSISILEDLELINTKLNNLIAIFGFIPMSDSIKWLSDEIERIKNSISKEINPSVAETEENISKLKKCTEKLLEQILIVVQNLYKKYTSIETRTEKTNTEEKDEEEETELKDGHLKTLIVDELFKDIETLEMEKVLNYFHKVLTEFYKTGTKSYKTTLAQIQPLLEQILLLYQYFITQQVSAYRLTCKMSSILSNIFIDLATKGFCVPPEFSEELGSEGENQQAGGGLGLGEGEGEKDVSEKIESEDQLEDAQPAGQEKEKQDDKDCKEEEKGIEMSEDFEGKMQDVDKDEDNEDKSDSDGEADEQMGETDNNADQLDQQIWGSDDEDGNESGDEEQNEEKGSKGEKQGEDELGAKESNENNQEEHDPTSKDSKEKNKKEINEMEEPELDDEQVDPYHGNQPEYPEPEAMDLPDDLQLDEGGEDKEDAQDEQNPFDIDAMKEQMPPQEPQPAEEDAADDKSDAPKDNPDSDESDDESGENKEKKDNTEPEEVEGLEETQPDDIKKTEEPNTEKSDENKETNIDESGLDETETKEDQVQAMEVDDVEAADKVQMNASENQKSSQPNNEVNQEDNKDKEGVGQSRMEESKTGHKGEATAEDNLSSNRQEEEEHKAKRKPGESDSKRSLGDINESIKKKLKAMDIQEGEDSEKVEDDQNEKQEENAEMYQHIKDATGKDDQILDTATKEQAEEQKEVPNLNEEKAKEAEESSENLPEEMEEDNVEANEVPKQKAEKIDGEKKKQSDKGQHPEGDILDELQDVNIEGEIVPTMNVPRGGESTYHTQYSNLNEATGAQLTVQEINQIRGEVEKQLSVWNEPPTSVEAERTWEKISSVTSSLAQGLSEQLRLVLEPTQASHLKGDYRTGRRINMRKVIPYIASQFRKDKIWLRRTKPSKREYQIALAIDDSSSMSDNRSKELAFESVALISKALTLLESGQLAVLSFGESTDILHKLTDTFTEKSGSKLLQKFKFDQKKTCVAKLVDFATEMLSSAQSFTNALIAKLLIIVSDGRGIFSEGETYVQQAVRRAKLLNIFMIFVIIDNPESKDSILDIRMPVFKDGKLLGIKSYMDVFPFPFYIILRDINSLPNVLSDALRQWFEIVSNVDK